MESQRTRLEAVGAFLWCVEVTYFLLLSGARVMGSVPLPVSTFNAAKSMGSAWKLALRGSAEPFTLKITDEKGVTLWTL